MSKINMNSDCHMKFALYGIGIFYKGPLVSGFLDLLIFQQPWLLLAHVSIKLSTKNNILFNKFHIKILFVFV
jgi:hypothetical protein